MKTVVIGESSGASMETIMAVYPRHKAVVDTFVNRGEVIGKQAVYTPKLIFTKTMFQKTKKIKLPKKLNFKGDTIILEGQWIENSKTCYAVRINNKEDGKQTSYAYAI